MSSEKEEFIDIPVVDSPLTEQELADITAWAQESQAKQEEESRKEQAKVSALGKLKALGLTEDEAKAVFGF